MDVLLGNTEERGGMCLDAGFAGRTSVVAVVGTVTKLTRGALAGERMMTALLVANCGRAASMGTTVGCVTTEVEGVAVAGGG